MYRILHRKQLCESIVELWVEAPLVAAKAKAGQFVILRVEEGGERIPLTIAGAREDGAVRIIFQVVGATTLSLSKLGVGDSILDFVGPLGRPTHTEGLKRVCVIGGGVGCAIALPVAAALKEQGCEVCTIAGFRTKDLVMLEGDLREASHTLHLVTDDGSYGSQGRVTTPLSALLQAGESFDMVFAIGPLPMMRAVVETLRPTGVPVTVSMNPIMIDGTGMCGGCRLTLLREGKRVTSFACVEGPDYNGYEVDFDEAISRSRMYQREERAAHHAACHLMKEGDHGKD